MLDIPQALADQVQEGRIVLLLGAGASVGAENAKGENPPTGSELAKLIAAKFLGQGFDDTPLNIVGELAISEAGLVTVQEFLRETLTDFKPAQFHRLLPTFKWRGLATTNYDLVVEYAYDAVPMRSQQLVPFRSDRDRVQDFLKSPDSLPFLKLHGCITRTSDPEVPLILTPDQYVTHRFHRERLFSMLKEWGYEYSIVFVGQSLQDSDLRQLLLELSGLGAARPRYFLVTPNPSDPVRRFWESRRVSVLDATFAEFVEALDARLPGPVRGAVVVAPTDHPIAARFSVPEATLTKGCYEFLSHSADFVHGGLPAAALEPKEFYRGVNKDWASIEQDLDVRRRLTDTLLSDVVLSDEDDGRSNVEIHVIKAEAGAGKTICLRRIAWDAALQFEKLCLWIKEEGRLGYECVYEIAQVTKERIFLFVDNAAKHVDELLDVLTRAKRDGIRLTIFTAERNSAWNMACERLDPEATGEYRLSYLSEPEIEKLVTLLQQHGSLGKLDELSHDDRIEAFVKRAGRQLLVALHEATQGKPFEDILVDEYEGIQPAAARTLYLSVCVLNRLGVGVRAGLIARVHEIPFSEFRERLFKPLEHVVEVRYDSLIKDNLYAARHPLIAEIVFERILTDPGARFDNYVRLVAGLNLAYDTDRTAFFQLMRARNIMDLFADYDTIMELFRTATKVASDQPFLFHQQGIYEMRRANHNLIRAAEHLNHARTMAPHDRSIIHSLAELELLRAEASTTQLEKEHHREEARRLALPLREDPVRGSYGYHTLLKLSLDRLRETLAGNPADRDIDEQAQELERLLDRALQRFPGDAYLLTAEADFGSLLKDDDRVFHALKKAFEANRRSPFIARSLAKAYVDRGMPEDAVRTLEEALEANRGEKRLHFALAITRIELANIDIDTALFHLRRSFTPGDDNYTAQFWYAFYLFMSNTDDGHVESRNLFKALARAPLSRDLRTKVRARFLEDGAAKSFHGRIARMESTYGFIERDGPADWIFMHEDTFGGARWDEYRPGMLVTFEIGFNFAGSIALAVRPSN